MKKILILLFIAANTCLCMKGQAQSIDDSTQIYTDSNYHNAGVEEDQQQENKEKKSFEKPTMRIVSSDTIKKLSAQKGFAYMQYIDSFYRHTIPVAPEVEQQQKKPSGSIFDITGIRILYWSLALIAVLFILYKLLLGNTALFARNKKINPTQTTEGELPLTIDNLATLIQNAISEKNYRSAIRLMYMQALSNLGDKHLLVLAPQKTNYQYVQELKGNNLQRAFSKLTMHYEYAWFGNFPVNTAQFETIQKEYTDFKNLL